MATSYEDVITLSLSLYRCTFSYSTSMVILEHFFSVIHFAPVIISTCLCFVGTWCTVVCRTSAFPCWEAVFVLLHVYLTDPTCQADTKYLKNVKNIHNEHE